MAQQNKLVVTNQTKQLPVCDQGMLANTFKTRLVGLLGQKSMEEQSGLLIRPSSGVHTFGMSMPIDVVALDRDHKVIGTWDSVKPWKVVGLSLRTKSVLELPAGRINRCQISVGDQLSLQHSA